MNKKIIDPMNRKCEAPWCDKLGRIRKEYGKISRRKYCTTHSARMQYYKSFNLPTRYELVMKHME